MLQPLPTHTTDFPANTTRQAPERAQATVEFALVLPVLALLLFGALQFGTAFWRVQQLSHAASAGARVASISRNSDTRTADIVDAVQDASPGLNPAITSSNVTVISAWDPGDQVTVRVSYPIELTVLGKTYYNRSFVSERVSRVEH